MLGPGFGGSGNQTDLLFLSPTQPATSYRSLLVHEFQHLINFHQHILVRGGTSEATWLDEGLSHVAEDLVDCFVSGGNSDNVREFLADPEPSDLPLRIASMAPSEGRHICSSDPSSIALANRSCYACYRQGCLIGIRWKRRRAFPSVSCSPAMPPVCMPVVTASPATVASTSLSPVLAARSRVDFPSRQP